MAETHGISSFGLRKRLAWGVLPPVALLLFLNAFWSYRGAVDATNRAYDRSLNASLNSIAENIHATGGVVSVDIPYSALDVSEGGVQERVYYAIIAPDGSLLTGDKGLTIPTMKAVIEEPVIIDTVFRGQPVRLGEMYGESRLIKLTEREAVLEGPSGVERLLLTPGIEKTNITMKKTNKSPVPRRTQSEGKP